MSEKKRYSLVIADMELNVITDASPDEVDVLVGILDRKMREINLKSRCCSKNEAALLCALEFCAERMAVADHVSELEARNEKYATVLAAFKEKLAALEAAEADLRRENALLRSLLGDGSAERTPQPPVTPTEFLAEVADAQTGDAQDDGMVQETIPVPTESAQPEKPAEQPKQKSRSRVGSMFDLLSFNEV